MNALKSVFVVLVLSALLVAPASASKPDIDALEKAGPQALLEALDKRHNHYPTQHWTFEMKVQPRSGDARVMTFEVWQKGNKRLARFLSPGEVKGMAVLNKGADKMWVYSSETGGKARRVASSARRQTLLGSDMTYEDMAAIDFSEVWNASFAGKVEGGKYRVMDLTPKSKGASAWSKLRIKVDREKVMIERIEYYDGDTLKKVQSRTQFDVIDSVPTYRTITMADQATGHRTILKMLSQKIGEDIKDSAFSKRSLIRGN